MADQVLAFGTDCRECSSADKVSESSTAGQWAAKIQQFLLLHYLPTFLLDLSSRDCSVSLVVVVLLSHISVVLHASRPQ